MKALVYDNPGNFTLKEIPHPEILHPSDIIVKILGATVCGTDLHITQGIHPEVPTGTVLGHEGVGLITQIGSKVTKFKKGDRVMIPSITSCGVCVRCQKGQAAHCKANGENGWLLGHTINGLQAEYARVPYADFSVYKVPDSLSDEEAIMAADVLPSSYEVGIISAKVTAQDVVVIIGDGPIGLASVLTAKLKKPSLIILAGIMDFRLEKAKKLGADYVINSSKDGWIDAVKALCPSGEADVVIEAVGKKETLEAAFSMVGVFGRVANIGVHTQPVTLPIQNLWIKNLTISSGMSNCCSIDELISLQASGKIIASELISHTFSFKDIVLAYDFFTNAEKNKANKIYIKF